MTEVAQTNEDARIPLMVKISTLKLAMVALQKLPHEVADPAVQDIRESVQRMAAQAKAQQTAAAQKAPAGKALATKKKSKKVG